MGMTNTVTHYYPGQVKRLPVLFFLALLPLGLLLASCVTMQDPEESQDYRSQIVGSLIQGQTIGQTIISRHKNLDGLQVWYNLDKSTAPDDGILTATIYKGTDDGEFIKSIPISFRRLSSQDTINIPLNLENNPVNQVYFIQFQTDKGNIQFFGRDEDAYPPGQLFINGIPQDADISFRVSYDYDYRAVIEDLELIIHISYLFIPLLLLIWLPGRLLLGTLQLKYKLDAVQYFNLSIGLSLAIIPTVILWTSFLNIRLDSWNIWLMFSLLLILYVWQNWGSIRASISRLQPTQVLKRKYLFYEAVMLVIFLIALFVRIAMIRDMSAPAWVDSVHHALISNLIIENGGYPDTYAPLVNIDTASYHSGFHSIVAVFYWLTKIRITDNLLFIGQIFNALIVIAVYALTVVFTNKRLAGLFAGLIVGLFTPMPAYYTSWGRYTQLAGLLILPTAFIFSVYIYKLSIGNPGNFFSLLRKKTTIILLGATAVTFSGLFLTHYRVAAFLGILIIVYILMFNTILLCKGKFIHKMLQPILLIGFAGLIAFLLTLPWWPKALSSLFIPRLEVKNVLQPTLFSDFSWAYLTSAYGKPVIGFAVVGLLIGAIKAWRMALTLILWILSLFILANANALGFPGAHFVNTTSVEIMLFIPLAILAGYAISWCIELLSSVLEERSLLIFIGILVIVAVVFSFLGAQRLLTILNPNTMLFRQADYPAMEWINENIPSDEPILINPFPWGYGLYAGSDGGYWISPLAGKSTMPPPALYGLSPWLSRDVKEISKNVIAFSDNLPKLHNFLLANDIEYIYIGAKGGALSPKRLSNSPLFKTIYSNNGTWVFQVIP